MKKSARRTNAGGGFTLAELLIVVAIIAVLVAVVIPVFKNQMEKSRQSTDISNLRSAYAAARYAMILNEVDGEPISAGTTYYLSPGSFVSQADAPKLGKSESDTVLVDVSVLPEGISYAAGTKDKPITVTFDGNGGLNVMFEGAGGGTGGGGTSSIMTNGGLIMPDGTETPWDQLVADGKITVNESGVIMNTTGLVGELIIPSSISDIKSSAFQNNSGLTSVTIQEGVTMDYDGNANSQSIFSGCTSLSYAELPASIKSVPYGTFGSCSSLTTLKINKGIEAFQYSALSGCTALEEIIYTGTMEDWSSVDIGGSEMGVGIQHAVTVHCSDGDTTVTYWPNSWGS